MSTATRHLGLVVILALLVGHASFAVHAAGHDLVDVAECKVCISHGNTIGAVDTDTAQGVAPVQDVLADPGVDDTLTARELHFARPRGPPSAD
jgi:hypothetical protein